MTRALLLMPYDPAWAQQYCVEQAHLQRVFGGEAVGIHHIGSTSIPGMQAKPIIDILVAVGSIEAVDARNRAMIVLGYEPKGEYGIPGRRFFCKGGEKHRSHHVHVFERCNPEVARHLNFCAYLRGHPNDAARYSALKAELVQKFRYDIDGYTEGKTALIHELDKKARAWVLEKSPIR